MDILESSGREIGAPKSLLGVCTVNDVAFSFYNRLGYVVDGESPPPRVMGDSAAKRRSWVLLSKPLNREEARE